MDPHGRLGRGLTSKQHHHQAPLCFVVYDTRMCLRKGQLNHVFVVFTALRMQASKLVSRNTQIAWNVFCFY